MSRPDGRAVDELRPLTLELGWTKHAEGSCLVRMGETWVLCTASVDDGVPSFLRGQGRGWVTAEYGMLPRATTDRSRRSLGGGRTLEIQRLIGRSLRAVEACEHLRRNDRISRWPLKELVAAISVGVVDGEVRLDLPYIEDAAAEVDMNVVMTASGQFVEVQGTAESEPFSAETLSRLLELAGKGIGELVTRQRDALGLEAPAA